MVGRADPPRGTAAKAHGEQPAARQRQQRRARRRRGRGGGRHGGGGGRRRGGRRRVGGRRWQEGGKHHVPVGGRAQGQAPLLRAVGGGQDVLEVGGGAAVLHVEDVRHRLAASGSRPSRLAGGEDGRHDQLAGGGRGGRARPCAGFPAPP